MTGGYVKVINEWDEEEAYICFDHDGFPDEMVEIAKKMQEYVDCIRGSYSSHDNYVHFGQSELESAYKMAALLVHAACALQPNEVWPMICRPEDNWEGNDYEYELRYDDERGKWQLYEISENELLFEIDIS